MVKRFGSLTWRLFGHPVPDSTAHFTVTAVTFSSPLIWLLLNAALHLHVIGTGTKQMQRVENLYREDGPPFAPTTTDRKSNKYTTVSVSLVLPTGAGHVTRSTPLFTTFTLSMWLVPVFACVFTCDPTLTVTVVDMIRLHLRAKILFCTQSCPILKNTLQVTFSK